MPILGQGTIVADKPHTSEQVWFDSYFFNQYPLTNYNPDRLVAAKGAKIYRKMMEDEQVKAAYEFIVSIIVSRKYRFEIKEEDETQLSIKRFFEWNIETALTSTFKQALKSILLSKAHGFSLSEKIFQSLEFEGKPSWAIKSIKPKFFDSFDLQSDEYGNLDKIYQTQNGKVAEYNLSDFIYHVNFPEYEPIYGVSDLKAAYKAFWQKSVVEKLWAIYMERMSGGSIVAKPDPDKATVPNSTEQNDFKNALKNMGASPGLMLPKGWELEVNFPNSTDNFEKFISMKDRQIARALLMPSLSGLTEQQSTGSQALATVQKDLFFDIMATQAEQLEDTLNEQLFASLALWNFNTTEFPKFKFDPYTESQKRDLALTWAEAVDKKIVINTKEDESRTRTLLNYPQRAEDSEPLETDEIEENEDAVDTSNGGVLPDEEEASFNFSETNIKNIDVEGQKKNLDFLEGQLKKRLSVNLSSIISSVLKSTREFMRVNAVDPSPLTEQLKRVQLFIPVEKKEKFNKEVEASLESTYKKGRSLATKEMKALDPSFTFSERGLQKLENFNILHFVDGLSLEKAEDILRAETFNITGILEEDILKAARQVLLDAIQNDLSIEKTIQNLKESLSTVIGGVTIEDANGKVIFDLEDQHRLETIARTNINNVFNQAKLGIYTDPELDNFVKAFEYTAVLDSRTSDFCRRYDGFIRLVNDPIWKEITPPNHFNCRSTLIPLTELDTFTKTGGLPTEKGKLTQPGKGFGIVSNKMKR